MTFDDHAWECRRNNATSDPWWWDVYRDGVHVGYLSSPSSGFLDGDSFYTVYDTSEVCVPSLDLTYTRALMLLHRLAEGESE